MEQASSLSRAETRDLTEQASSLSRAETRDLRSRLRVYPARRRGIYGAAERWILAARGTCSHLRRLLRRSRAFARDKLRELRNPKMLNLDSLNPQQREAVMHGDGP